MPLTLCDPKRAKRGFRMATSLRCRCVVAWYGVLRRVSRLRLPAGSGPRRTGSRGRSGRGPWSGRGRTANGGRPAIWRRWSSDVAACSAAVLRWVACLRLAVVVLRWVGCLRLAVVRQWVAMPPFGGGGPRFGGGGPGFGPADFLRRLDENGNGMIDPSESQGRASFFLQRMAADIPELDLKRPISIDKLAKAMEKLREQRMRDGGSRDGGDRSGRGGEENRGSTATAALEPLVPGFGVEEFLPPPPGFGAEGELPTVKTTEADLRKAQDRIARDDGNKDGVLDREEVGRGRWGDDPWSYDRNHDGRLTASELAARYARRRGGTPSTPGAPAGSVASTSARGGSPPGGGADPRMEGILEQHLRTVRQEQERRV